jgi:hypothetical protein
MRQGANISLKANQLRKVGMIVPCGLVILIYRKGKMLCRLCRRR